MWAICAQPFTHILLPVMPAVPLSCRIEDTDQKRKVEDAVAVIKRTMAGCGLDYDEGPDVGGPVGPYVQTQRQELYRKYAELLVEKGAAYQCFCSEARLEALHKDDPNAKYDRCCLGLTPEEIQAKLAAREPYVIRQRIPEGTTTFHDVVYGDYYGGQQRTGGSGAAEI